MCIRDRTNCCIFDCKYCINRKTNNVKRAIFTPEEICTITMNFYRRNYIEGLFLSSGIIKSPDYTMELLIKTIKMLRYKYHFHGYKMCIRESGYTHSINVISVEF